MVDTGVVDEALTHTSPASCFHEDITDSSWSTLLTSPKSCFHRRRIERRMVMGGRETSYDSHLDWLIQSKAGLESVR